MNVSKKSFLPPTQHVLLNLDEHDGEQENNDNSQGAGSKKKQNLSRMAHGLIRRRRRLERERSLRGIASCVTASQDCEQTFLSYLSHVETHCGLIQCGDEGLFE